MKIHEFGNKNAPAILLIHPSLVMWDYYEAVVPLLEERYHVFVPALPGYDKEEKSDFTSVEAIAKELADYLLEQGIMEVACISGCSMGGSVAIRFLSDQRIKTKSALIDGGITPYQLPWILTRFIALRDFLMIWMGKLGGIKLLEKAFATDSYSDEDLQYIADVLYMVSAKTIWRTFDSANNYKMPEPLSISCQKIAYWYSEKEEKEREWDIAYMKKKIPQTRFRRIEDLGHGGLAVLRPDLLVAGMEELISEKS